MVAWLMPSAHDLSRELARRVAGGELADGTALPSHRALAGELGASAATVARAYSILAKAGVVTSEGRRLARVAADGRLAALGLLRAGAIFRLAGSDDPALDHLLQACAGDVQVIPTNGSAEGLTALWKGRSDGAAIHLLHRDGTYNIAYARAILRSRDPVLVHLWHREQGILVAAGNPLGIGSIGDVGQVRLARRRAGTGTRVLEELRLRESGIELGDGHLEVAGHLDVAFAVASGLADAGIAVRAAAWTLDLGFVPLAWEPFQIATTAAALGGVEPLLAQLRRPTIRREIEQLGGYDLREAGEVTYL